MTRRAAIAALAGAFVPARNPLTDPRPFDVLEKNGIQVHVYGTIHDAAMDVIVARKFKSGELTEVIWCDLAHWREQCVGAVVIQRAEVFDGA